MSEDYPGRDFEQEFAITLKWHQWTRVLSLVDAGSKWKSSDEVGLDWSGTDETRVDEEIIGELKQQYFDTRPGNGMSDWPDSMQKAYSECVRDMVEDRT